MKNKIWLIILIVVVIAFGLIWWGVQAGKKQPTTIADPAQLPGLQIIEAPWTNGASELRSRLAAIGLPALQSEGNILHTHQHLDIFVHGQAVTIPSGIGQGLGFISPLHTHDATGVIHVESPVIQTFTLGQFFDVWGVRLTARCLGSYCGDAANTLTLYVNGKQTFDNPRDLVLADRQEIVLVYGSPSEKPLTIPASYSFSGI